MERREEEDEEPVQKSGRRTEIFPKVDKRFEYPQT